MFGMSFVELGIVAVIALLLLGPDQLPGVARALGKGLRDLRRASDDLKQTFEQEMVKLEADITPKAPPKPRTALPAAPSAAAEPSLLESITGPIAAGLTAVSLDQARQASPRVDPGALRAQARAAAAPLDPGAARAAARMAALAPVQISPAPQIQLEPASTPAVVPADASSVVPAPLISADIKPDSSADISPVALAQAEPAPAVEPLPPEDEFQSPRGNQARPPVAAPTSAPPETAPRRKPDPS